MVRRPALCSLSAGVCSCIGDYVTHIFVSALVYRFVIMLFQFLFLLAGMLVMFAVVAIMRVVFVLRGVVSPGQFCSAFFPNGYSFALIVTKGKRARHRSYWCASR